MAVFRILSLDGGGVWALLQLRALQALYPDQAGKEITGHQVLEKFDLVAASGGGSIALAGLVMNMPLSVTLRELFLDSTRRHQLFTPEPSLNIRKWLGGARYSSKVKLGALESFLGKYSRLSLPALVATIRRDLKVCPHLIISAYDRDRNRAEFFRSDTGSRSASAIGPATPDPEASLDPQFPQILHASTVGLGDDFHPPPRIGNSRFCEGGAAGFCNPVLAAVTEAFANKEDPRDIRVLSIGSGTIQPPTPRISVLTNPPEVATFIAHVMLGQDMPHAAKHPVSGNVVRMSPVAHIKPKDTRGAPEGLSESQFQRLAGLEIHAVEQEQIELIQDLGNRWVDGKVWNQPIRPSRDYTCEIGQPTFAAARDAWHNLTK